MRLARNLLLDDDERMAFDVLLEPRRGDVQNQWQALQLLKDALMRLTDSLVGGKYSGTAGLTYYLQGTVAAEEADEYYGRDSHP